MSAQAKLGATAVLSAVTREAAGVVRLRQPEAAAANIGDLVDAVREGLGGQVRAQSGLVGLAVANPTQAGVDKTGDWYAAVYLPEGVGDPGVEPEVVYIIPASDLGAMRQAIEAQDLAFFEHGAYGVYTSKDSGAFEQTKKLLSAGGANSLSGQLSDAERTLLDEGDVSLYINVPRVKRAFADDWDRLLQQARQASANLPTESPLGNTAQFGEVLAKILQGTETAANDARGCTIAARLSKAGVLLEDLLRFNEGGVTRFLAKHTPSEMPALGQLPAASAGYLGLSLDLPGLMTMALDLAANGLGNKGGGVNVRQELAGVKFGSQVSSLALGDLVNGLVKTVTVTEISDPMKMRDVTRRQLGSLNTVDLGNGLKQKYSLKPGAETLGGVATDVMQVEMQIDPNDPQGAMVAQAMGTLYGPEGMVTRSAYLKERMVQTAGGGGGAMEQTLKQLATGPRREGTDVETRSRLAPRANVVGLLDLPGTVAKALSLFGQSDMGKMFVPLLDDAAIEQLEMAPSYTGLSLVAEKDSVRAHTQIPADQIRGGLVLYELLPKVFPQALGR
ncbi:MAG: hypothetical protein ACKOGA_00120 [Planctomycetaceae bacterium]